MVNIFENRVALKKFVEISNSFKGKDKKTFSGIVKALFVKKTTSDDGEYSIFKITVADLDTLKNMVTK